LSLFLIRLAWHQKRWSFLTCCVKEVSHIDLILKATLNQSNLPCVNWTPSIWMFLLCWVIPNSNYSIRTILEKRVFLHVVIHRVLSTLHICFWSYRALNNLLCVMKGKITEFAMCDARGIDCINKRLEKILF
jgi:hypothetical protein